MNILVPNTLLSAFVVVTIELHLNFYFAFPMTIFFVFYFPVEITSSSITGAEGEGAPRDVVVGSEVGVG